MRAALLLPTFFAVVAACSGGDDDPPRCSGFVGDPNQPPVVEAIVTMPEGYNEDGEIARLKTVMGEPGMRVPLIQAPQGGKHIFAGVRVKNLDTCPVTILGVVRDTSGRVKLESRPVDFLAAEDGWAYAGAPTQIASYANIPMCPNVWSDRDVFEQPYELQLRATDRDGRKAEVVLSITPYCGEPAREAECMCSCKESATLTCGGETPM